MNVKELIEKIEALPAENYKYRPWIDKKVVLGLVRQLDEPQKVVVPQFVADVIEGAREKSPELEDALHYTWGNGTKEFTEWYNKKSNRDLFARAWLDGYEAEKEKRYLVKMKRINGYGKYLNKNLQSKEYFFASNNEIDEYRTKFTHKELEEDGFGWVFDCEGIEIEEVE